jgi:hypothetical protein
VKGFPAELVLGTDPLNVFQPVGVAYRAVSYRFAGAIGAPEANPMRCGR